MKTNLNILPVVCLLCLCACKNGNASGLNKTKVAQDTIKTFTLPTIPTMMTVPEPWRDTVKNPFTGIRMSFKQMDSLFGKMNRYVKVKPTNGQMVKKI